MLIISLILFIFGAVFGSFAGAQVWRLRAKQLTEDRAAGEVYDKKEYSKLLELTKHHGADDRSRCLSCKHELAWYDLIPFASWISTKGRCRYCHKSIGKFEPMMELGVGVIFVVSYLFWPQALTEGLEIAQFGVWLVAVVMLAILFAYDAKWFLLPDRIIIPLVVVSALFAGIELYQVGEWLNILSLLGAIAVLSGIYLILWLISKGQWIGFGDVKLGIALACLVVTWDQAFLTLFLANLIGCLIVLPGMIFKKVSRTSQVPFGPMLIGATLISVLWGQDIVASYLSVTATLML